MAVADSRNYRSIDDHVATSGRVASDDLAGLRSEGFEVVVNLLPDQSPYALAGEREIVEAQGLEYVHVPVDFARPTVTDYEEFERVMDRIDGRRALIHCAANYRASAFYSCWAVRRGRWTREEADRLVGSLWNPAEHPGWPELLAAIDARR